MKYKFYLKKASKQDKTRTTVINSEAIDDFFGVSLVERDDDEYVRIRYLSENIIDESVKIVKKQDPRIFIDRSRFNKDDILLFTSNEDRSFDLQFIRKENEMYDTYKKALNRNFLLTNNLPSKEIISKNMQLMTHPLNQILYGPPGTGKTYSTITKALDIIGIEYHDYEEAQELFQNELGKRIEFVTMHQSFSYEDFVQGLKPVKQDGSDGITFDYKNGVFKEICERAEATRSGDSSSNFKPISNRDLCKVGFFLAKYNGKKKNEKKANEFLGYTSDNEAFIGIGKKLNENPNSIKNHRDKFDYIFTDSNGYTARKGWTPRNNDGILDNTTKWPYQDVYNELKNNTFEENKIIIDNLLKGNSSAIEENTENENFVIILDEINRANISRVFGELIALIEKDKRDGKLTATLPSGEQLTVPSNLYIIGTMNTADKSIALVDIALRRRFEFIPLYPNSNTLETVLQDKVVEEKEINNRVNLLNNLNRIIRTKKSVDFEIGHSYFMSDDNLINILNKQILPLLNEYFMYDLRRVKELIEKQQRDLQGNNIPKLGIELDQNVWNERGLLQVCGIKDLDYVVEDRLASAAESNSEYN